MHGKMRAMRVVNHVFKHAHHRSAFAVIQMHCFRQIRFVTHEHRMRMAGVRVAQFAAVEIGDDVGSCREHRNVRLAQNALQRAIEPSEKFAGIVAHDAQFLDERAQNRRDQRGANAVSHHVANEHACHRVGEVEDVEKVAADRSGGGVDMREMKCALLGIRSVREMRIFLWFTRLPADLHHWFRLSLPLFFCTNNLN